MVLDGLGSTVVLADVEAGDGGARGDHVGLSSVAGIPLASHFLKKSDISVQG